MGRLARTVLGLVFGVVFGVVFGAGVGAAVGHSDPQEGILLGMGIGVYLGPAVGMLVGALSGARRSLAKASGAGALVSLAAAWLLWLSFSDASWARACVVVGFATAVSVSMLLESLLREEESAQDLRSTAHDVTPRRLSD